MKVSPTIVVLLGSCLVFLVTPYLPSYILHYTVGTKLGSTALFALVLYVLYQDNVLGIAVFLAVGALFLEQRRRTVEKVVKVPTKNSTVAQLIVPAPNIVPGEVHPERKVADVDDYSFEPTEESGTNTYENIDESYDTKQALPTVPPHPDQVSDLLQEKGLAHLN